LPVLLGIIRNMPLPAHVDGVQTILGCSNQQRADRTVVAEVSECTHSRFPFETAT